MNTNSNVGQRLQEGGASAIKSLVSLMAVMVYIVGVIYPLVSRIKDLPDWPLFVVIGLVMSIFVLFLIPEGV